MKNNHLLNWHSFLGMIILLCLSAGITFGCAKSEDESNKNPVSDPKKVEKNMSEKRVLIVVTSHEDLGDTGEKTGYYLPEVTHPYYALKEKGLDIVFISPKGGKAPMDEKSRDLEDAKNKQFVETPETMRLLENTQNASDIDAKEFRAIVFTGGHGTMWDFPDDKNLQNIASTIYEDGGVVAAVCHGPAALVNIKLSDGNYLIKGKKFAAFTNDEEDEVKLSSVVPFMLVTKLIERGGKHESAPNWQPKVVVDQRLVTGQNPASAEGVGDAVAELLTVKN